MSQTSTIEWTDRTWNPVRGCSVISPGCVNCYAMKQAHRFSGSGKAYEGLTKQTKAGPQWTGAIREVPEALGVPLRWRKPSRVFVNSMSDLFHPGVSEDFIKSVFTVMAIAKRHTFQILTKRPDRMRDIVSSWRADDMYDFWYAFDGGPREIENWPLPNVWIGVSAEDQQRADERIPHLLQTPAAVRFVSAEPLLGRVDIQHYMPNALWNDLPSWKEPELDWVIVGGESGPKARPCDVAWVRGIVEQCRDAGVAVFVKQLGSRPQETFARRPEDPAFLGDGWMRIRRNDTDGADLWFRNVTIENSKGGDPAEWPRDLRVRQFPRQAVSR